MINLNKKSTIAIYALAAVVSSSSSYHLVNKAFDHFDAGKEQAVNTVIVRTVPTEKVIIKNNTPTTTTVDTVETYNPGEDSSANTGGKTPTGSPEEGNDNTSGNGENQQRNNSNNTGSNNQQRNVGGNNYPEEGVNTPQRNNSPNIPNRNTPDRGNSNRGNDTPTQQGNTPHNNGNSPSPTDQGNTTQGNNGGGNTPSNGNGGGEQLFPNIPLPNLNTENNGNTAGESGI